MGVVLACSRFRDSGEKSFSKKKCEKSAWAEERQSGGACTHFFNGLFRYISSWGAYHLTEKSGWGVESLMVSDLPVYRRNATSVTV